MKALSCRKGKSAAPWGKLRTGRGGLARATSCAVVVTFAWVATLGSQSSGGESGFRLSDQESELYYNVAVAAGEEIRLEGGAAVAGNLHSNGGIDLKKDSRVQGDVAAVGSVRNQGTVLGAIDEETEPVTLPLLLDSDSLRQLADRVFEGDVTFTDEVINDVVFVAGSVRVLGSLNGVGTVIARGDIRVGRDALGEDAQEGGEEGEPVVLEDDTRISLIAVEDIRIGKDRPFRGVLRSGRDVMLEKNQAFEGVIVAERTVHVKKDSMISFLDFDQVPPTVTLITPQDGSFVATATPEIVLELADDFSGLRDDVELLLDEVDRSAEAVLEEDRLTLTLQDPLVDGLHTLEVSISDHSDNVARQTFSFTTDTVAPTLEISSPTEPLVINTVPPVVVSYADATSGVDLGSVVVSLDDAALADCDVGSASTTCAPPQLAEGSHTLTATIADNAGNPAAASFEFELVFDMKAPVITLVSPSDGDVVQDLSVEVSGTVMDESGVAGVTVNGQPATLSGDSFTALVNLVAGPNTLVVEAVDVVGNAGSVSITVTVASDTTPPTLTLTAPLEGVFLTDNRPQIELRFDDDDSGVDPGSLGFTVNGLALAVSCSLDAGGGSCTPVAGLPEGAIDLEASLKDLAGNEATAGVQFTVDTAGVEITIVEPVDGALTAQAEVTVLGTLGPDVASVEVNGVSAIVSGSSFSASVPLREGTQMVVALATKGNGNTGTTSVEVTRDNVAPIVKIDAPRDGFVAVSDRVTVTGLVNDVVNGQSDPRVFVNGIEATVLGGSFMVVDVPLVRGPNALTAVARDAVGNEATDTINVTFEVPVGARVGIESGQGQFELVNRPLPEPLVVAVSDDLGNPVAGRVVTFEVTRNSGTLRATPSAEPDRVVQVPTDGSGRAAVLLTLGDTAGEGNNRVRATALGVAGEVEFCASALAAPANKILMVDGDNQRGVVGHPLPVPLQALVVDGDGNPIPGLDVIFQVVKGGGNLDGESTRVRSTAADGVARSVLTLGREPGINNNVVRATVSGVDGLPATFVASGLAAGDPAETRFSGVVLDNGQTPIPGALVHVPGTAAQTVTDAEGQFLLRDVPVGQIVLEIDPTNSPRLEAFPHLAFETVTVSGQNNTLGQPILIPAIDLANAKVVGGDEDVTLVMEGVAGLELTVFANSVTFPDGSKTGLLSISQVHLDKVPMPPPSGTIFMPPAWTIQPAGVAFDPPARISIPNDNLPPGRVIDIFQFDHSFNEFINIGKGTVSDDAFVITSDPGFGVTRAGWGGCGQPQPPPTCPSSCDDGNDCTTDSCQDGSCVHEPLFAGGCDDGSECTANDRCQEGECKGDPVAQGTPCGGSTNMESCTLDMCDGEGSCQTGEPKEDGTACDDMTFCTMPDECMGGQCEGEEPEEMECAPIDIDETIDIGPYDIIVATIPKFALDVDIQGDVNQMCCEERMIKEAVSSSGSGTFSGEASGLDIGVPGPGTVVRLIDRVLCKRIINRIPKTKCKVGVEIKIDGVEANGSFEFSDDQCADTSQFGGGGTVTVTGFALSGTIEVSLFRKENDDDDSGIKVSGDLSGTDNINGTIEAAENNLLVTFSDTGLTVAGSITVPIPFLGNETFSLDHTFEPFGTAGPYTIGVPPIPRDCR